MVYKRRSRWTERAVELYVAATCWTPLSSTNKKMYEIHASNTHEHLSPVLTPSCAMNTPWEQPMVSDLSGCKRLSRAAVMPGMGGKFGVCGPECSPVA